MSCSATSREHILAINTLRGTVLCGTLICRTQRRSTTGSQASHIGHTTPPCVKISSQVPRNGCLRDQNSGNGSVPPVLLRRPCFRFTEYLALGRVNWLPPLLSISENRLHSVNPGLPIFIARGVVPKRRDQTLKKCSVLF